MGKMHDYLLKMRWFESVDSFLIAIFFCKKRIDDLTAKYNHIIHTISGMMQLHETGVNDDLPYSIIIFTGVFRMEQNKIFSVFIWR